MTLATKIESENVWENMTVHFKMRNARRGAWQILADMVWLFQTQHKRHMPECVR